jgi:hypothetical protein
MKTELIQAEVRLYFNGRTDYETEFFTATCPTDMQMKAADRAKKRGANHFNAGIATEEDENQNSGSGRRFRTIAAPTSVKDQVAAIEASLGMEKSRSKN